MREIQHLCSCAGIGWVLLLLCQLIESKAPNPKKVQEHPKSKERPRVSKSKRKTSIIQDPKERPRASKIRRRTSSFDFDKQTSF